MQGVCKIKLQSHIITEQLKAHLQSTSCVQVGSATTGRKGLYAVLNISKARDSTASLGYLLQY